MIFVYILIGLLIGLNIYFFTYLASKNSKHVYLAPLFTFLSIVLFMAYGMLIVGGWAGMTYLFISFGILIIAIIGTVLLPIISRKSIKNRLSKLEKINVVIFPALLVSIIVIIDLTESVYWVVDEGDAFVLSDDSYYRGF
ncbi:hypothetical protein [Aquibacillus rhizosphaerae]|uniref:Multipass membrane protein n=1 Tax=Aquibacillus rhizosphaerae TaxID=3051431 RepID=A0ABT7L1X1_9BACI|nr:hypothetical protein [Aquibacillus sp. LR5S19]MDL4839850.1 hypothetical protein [Aquibacillus sp. LR5S19]